MCFKLAFRNMRRSMRDFTVYFITLMLGISIFYVFNSIEAQQAMLIISDQQLSLLQALTKMMGYVSAFVAVVLGFLILYANRFLIRRRKKELGMYTMLGMERGAISRIIVLETLFIGVFALAAGLALGIFLSQGLSVLTAKMLTADMRPFQFVFSRDACLKSILFFGIIFLVVMAFNVYTINRYKLIDLMQEEKKNEELKVRSVKATIVIFILSVICLGAAYYLIDKNGMLVIDITFTMSLILGSLGTYLFFLSLSGFLLRTAQLSKRMYFKDLNMFVLRQINNRINTAHMSMTVICIMLLIVIGTLSTGFGMSSALTDEIEFLTPYDACIDVYKPMDEEAPEEDKDMVQLLRENGMELSEWTDAYSLIDFKYDSNLKFSNLVLETPEDLDLATYETFSSSLPRIISEGQFNEAMGLQGGEEVSLGGDEFLLVCNFDKMYSYLEEFVQSGRSIAVNGTELLPARDSISRCSLENSSMAEDTGTVVVPDTVAQPLYTSHSVINVRYRQDDPDGKKLTEKLASVRGDGEDYRLYVNWYTRQEVYEQSVSLSTIVTYLCIYVGIVFLVACAAVLALQQLTEASDSTGRYNLLRKIGAEEKMINRALFRQTAIYFMVPLLLAIVHSYVGISVANRVITIFGKLDIVRTTITTALLFIVVYGSYFLATYFGCKGMIRSRSTSK